MRAVSTSFWQLCPECGRPLRVPVQCLGQTVACEHCPATFVAREGDTEIQPENGKTPDKSSIAALSANLIDSMTCDELVRIIGASEVPTLRGSDFHGRLAFYGRDTLVRLAHLARRCCQNH